MTDPLALVDEIARADARLDTTAVGLTEAALAEPSLLPSWTRGHVLSHLARNADALTNLLTWARTGVETPLYASAQARVDGIEAGAGRPLDVQLSDLRAAAARFAKAAAEMPPAAWSTMLGEHGTAGFVMWRRLREVEVHHVDLDAGYTTADWKASFTQRFLRELVGDRTAAWTGDAVTISAEELAHPLRLGSGTPPITVAGPAHELAGWLSGRSAGSSLSVSPTGPLPALTNWK